MEFEAVALPSRCGPILAHRIQQNYSAHTKASDGAECAELRTPRAQMKTFAEERTQRKNNTEQIQPEWRPHCSPQISLKTDLQQDCSKSNGRDYQYSNGTGESSAARIENNDRERGNQKAGRNDRPPTRMWSRFWQTVRSLSNPTILASKRSFQKSYFGCALTLMPAAALLPPFSRCSPHKVLARLWSIFPACRRFGTSTS